jgi:predicted cupin superfamily sugar epimerase
MDYKKIIEKLNLVKHPEGGYYAETYRSERIIPKSALNEGYSGERNYATLIYYMLTGNDISCFHKLRSDEIWHFYAGSPVLIYLLDDSGKIDIVTLGNNPDNGEVFQYVIKAGTWFGAELKDKSSYALMGCTVTPGFNFEDFEIGKKDELLKRFPLHAETISKLT